MIDIAKLKSHMSILGDHIKKLKKLVCDHPTLENVKDLKRHQAMITKLYVLRASLRNKHHVRTATCGWHHSIVLELAPKYLMDLSATGLSRYRNLTSQTGCRDTTSRSSQVV